MHIVIRPTTENGKQKGIDKWNNNKYLINLKNDGKRGKKQNK